MAILKMNKISIYAVSSQIKGVLELLHKEQIVEITESDLLKTDTERLVQNLDSTAKMADEAIEVLNKYSPPEHTLFKKRYAISQKAYDMDRQKTEEAARDVARLLRYKSRIDKNKENISRINIKCELLSPYKSLDLPMRTISTGRTQTVTGTCDAISEYALSEMIREQKLHIYFEIVNSTKQKNYVWFVYLKEDAEKAEEFFKSINFSVPNFSLSHHTPTEKIKILMAARADIEAENEETAEKIKSFSVHRKNIELYYDHILLKKEKYEAVAKIGTTDSVFVINGYIPEKFAEPLKQKLEKSFCAAVEAEPVSEDEEPPVAFSNNAFVAPVEEITSSYAMPSKTDIDPNPIMAFFYYWFFGMMFSDAGYGILMMLVCGILGFSGLMEKASRKMFKMFFYCGISTTVWGIVYGSFFGDMIGTVSKTFGSGRLSFKPILIDPVNQALQLLIIAVAFGMIHILTALFIKLYVTWKNGDKLGAVFDVGLWIVILLGASVMAVGMGLSADVAKTVGIYMMLGGAVGLVLTQGRDKKNIFAKFFAGILSLYDITSYVGDLLSYSRLMALGLATGVIASVVNVLGSLGGNTPLGVIMFILISLFGHAMNFAINMLGAYVHTNRLQYVEFYQKFYEGGGRKFNPFKLDTKYYDFSNN